MTPHGNVRNILGPEDLRLAGEVFEAALADVGESDLHPYAIRKTLAQSIMRQIFEGERDRKRLHYGALNGLRSLERGQDGRTKRFVPRSSNENVTLFAAKA